jgi:DNA-binding transcriptional ArsR family regulator
MEEFKPITVGRISDLETLKVIADPFRKQIIEILVPNPQTINQIAEKLGLSPSRLYYHVNLLEKHDLLRVVDTTVRGNIIEKHYWVTAYEYKIEDGLFNFGTPEGQKQISDLMVSAIETTREDIIRSLEARAYNLEHGAEEHPRMVLIDRVLSKLSDDQADEFIVRLKALIKDFEAADSTQLAEETQNHALAVVFYPSFYYQEIQGEGSDQPTEDQSQ